MSEQDEQVRPRNPLLVARRRETVLLFPTDVAEQLDVLVKELDAISAEIATLDDDIDQLRIDQREGAGPPTKMARKSPLEVALTKRDKLDKQREAKAAEIDKIAVEPPVSLVFEEPSSVAYERLTKKHPPRDDDRLDAMRGYNAETFAPALAQMCLVEPEVSGEFWDEFRESVSAFNWRKIQFAVHRLTDTEPDLPKPFAVSLLPELREREQRRQPDTE